MKPLVYVAMSGGIDSSVAAALLKERGFRVIGVFFKPWQAPAAVCNWQQDRHDAMRVAVHLGIDFKTWDFSSEYELHVARYMIDAYRSGLTPNPDVMCNKEIKFGLFLKRALEEGADYIATGHYARVRRTQKNSNIKLVKARDGNKDQTYFLWTLSQEQLRHCLFPIGDHTKPQVRNIARTFGLPNHDKKDSQGVCFVGELNMHDFLETYIEPITGNVILDGSVVGTHDGAAYYTLGQRHGLNIAIGGGPYYVAKKDVPNNTIYISRDAGTTSNTQAYLDDIHWIGETDFPSSRLHTSTLSKQIRTCGDNSNEAGIPNLH